MPRLEQEFRAARKDGAQLCVIMADIDHFKRVNDDHGHATGDAAIVAVAQVLLDEARDRERVCRYGGEEFCVVLWDASIEHAMELAERVRRRVESDGFTEIPLTASFGVSSVLWGAKKASALLEQADAALYASKEKGRNRVTRFDEVSTQG